MPGINNTFVYDTVKLISVVPNLKIAQTFLVDTFFPGVKMSDDEFVAIDVDVGLRRMAPFVSPLVEGKLVEQRRYQTNLFKPAYIKDKRAPDLRKPIRRMIGEQITGNSSASERFMANLQAEMEDQIQILKRRMEWMAAQALQFGTVTIAGDGFETQIVDFGRDPSLTVTLTGSAQWGVTANFDSQGRDPVPTTTIEAVQRNVLKKSGAKLTDIIFTTTPWLLFLNARGVYGTVLYDKFNSYANSANPGPQQALGAVWKGKWGNFDLWEYNDWYIDGTTNIETPMLADGTVLFCGQDIMGTQAFGVILDPRLGYVAMPFAPKTWIMEDPAQQLMMMQSSPIVIPERPNACACYTVCAPVYF
jgi:hypothetical protein